MECINQAITGSTKHVFIQQYPQLMDKVSEILASQKDSEGVASSQWQTLTAQAATSALSDLPPSELASMISLMEGAVYRIKNSLDHSCGSGWEGDEEARTTCRLLKRSRNARVAVPYEAHQKVAVKRRGRVSPPLKKKRTRERRSSFRSESLLEQNLLKVSEG